MTSGSSRAKDIFSTHDAAKICRVTPMTVIRWIKEGKIPAFKTAGGHRRILRSDLVRFCKTRGIPFPLEAEPEAWRILVVDSDAAVRHFIADAARKVDDKLLIEMAGDAWSAGQILASFKPNLVFLDAHLPGIDALEVTQRLTQQTEGEPPAVSVLVTQHNSDGERAFRSRGALGCIAKPPSELAVDRVVRTTFQLADTIGPAMPSIHIVDTDARLTRLIRRELEEKLPGCRVTLFESPIEALFALSVERPDLLLLDIGDMDLSPAEVLRRIAGHAWQPAVPVLAVSRAESMRAQALAAGARAFMVKPYTVETILAHLRPAPAIAAGHQRRSTRRK
jgi:excisionase family DNA binding protein